MSRDFELLQRLEREGSRPSISFDHAGRAPLSERHGGPFRVVPRKEHEGRRPAAWTSAEMRSELSRLVLRTFLATPAINSIMFTGVEARQSAKWLTACTADVLASSSSARVCLVDADLASPAMHLAYSVPNHNGLGMVLSGACPLDSAGFGIADNLWLIPAGATSENKNIVLERAQETFDRLLQDSDFLLISGPEYGTYPEITALGSAAGNAILVLDAMTTRRASAQRAKAMLEAAQVKVIGSVMTSQRDPVPDFLSMLVH